MSQILQILHLELSLRSQSSSEKIEELFEEQFTSMFLLIDEQIQLLGMKYPNENLVSASGSGGTSLTSSDVYGPIWRPWFFAIYPKAAAKSVRHCCGRQLPQCTRHADLNC